MTVVSIISLYSSTNTTSGCLKLPIDFVDPFRDAIPSSSFLEHHCSPSILRYQPSFSSPFLSSIPLLSARPYSTQSIYIYISLYINYPMHFIYLLYMHPVVPLIHCIFTLPLRLHSFFHPSCISSSLFWNIYLH